MNSLPNQAAVRFRAFISADIQPNDSLVSILGELGNSRADLKIVRPELLHLTLKFLGETEETLVDEIVARMERACEGIQPFTITLQGMGAFPSLSNIRVVWVGIEAGKQLEDIASKLDESMNDLGYERDRHGFKPHLTVARTKSTRNIANIQEILRANAATDFGQYPIDRILLKKSVLSPKGPTYSVVREQPLD